MIKKQGILRSNGVLQRYAHTIWMLQKFTDASLVVGMLVALSHYYAIPFTSDYVILAAITVLLTPTLFKFAGLYYSYRSEHPAAEFSRILLGWGLFITALLFLGYLTKTSTTFSRVLLCTWFVLVPLVICSMHLVVRMLLRRLRKLGYNGRTAVIAGTGELAGHLAEQFSQTPQLGIKFCGFFAETSRPPLEKIQQRPLIGTLEELPDYVRRFQIDVVYIALSVEAEAMVSKLINALQDTTVCVYFTPNILMFNLIQARAHDINGIPLIAVWERPFSDIEYAIKRVTDIIVSVLVLGLLFPLMGGIAIAVKLSSPGPILFKQRRYGLNGHEIVVYKFRTMKVSEDGPTITQATRNDSRVTAVGSLLRKTSLDELPQFINVLQGRMSIVGPRPHAVAHNEHYRKRIQGYMLRHIVKPGITGWAQIHGLRGETETLDKMKQRVEYDLHYLRHWSLGLDLKIILRTIWVLFEHQNAY